MTEEVFLPLSPRDKKGTMIACYMLFAVRVLGSFAVSIAIPSLMAYYDLVEYQAFVLAISSILGTTCVLVGGKLGQKYGRKFLTLFSASGKVITLLLIALKPASAMVFMVAYCLMSAFNGLIGAVHATIAADILPPAQRPKVMGIFGTINGVAMVVGIFGGGIMVDKLGPFSIFWVFLAPTVGAIFLYAVYFKNKISNPHEGFDIPGIVLIFLALSCITVWSNFGKNEVKPGQFGFKIFGPVGIGLLIGFAVFFLLFLRHQSKSDDGLMPLSLFKNNFFLTSFIIGFMIQPMVIIASTNLSIFAQQGMGLSASVTGTLALPKNIIYSIVPTFLGLWLAKNKSLYGKLVLMCGWGIAIGCALMLLVKPGSSLMWLYIGMVFMGFGTSAQVMILQPYMQLNTAPEKLGISSAAVNFSSSLGATFTNTIYSVCYTLKYNQLVKSGLGTLQEVSTYSFHALAIVSVLAGLAIVLTRYTCYVDPKELSK